MELKNASGFDVNLFKKICSGKAQSPEYFRSYYQRNKERISNKYREKYKNNAGFREKKKAQVKANYQRKKSVKQQTVSSL